MGNPIHLTVEEAVPLLDPSWRICLIQQFQDYTRKALHPILATLLTVLFWDKDEE
jgi:hypothetical protein